MTNQGQQEHARQLHERLLSGDPLAPVEMVETFIAELVRRVRARARQVNDDTIALDAATDALLEYIQHPERFDPNKSGLLTYLTMSAYGNFLNMLARESRRKKREVPLEDVEHILSIGNNIPEEAEDDILEKHGISTPDEKASFHRRVMEEFPDHVDRQLLSLMLSGERKTTAYSAVLGIQGSDVEEQRRLVKRHKDRLTKRLQRLGGTLREQKQKR
ncbi:MAG: sigma-70 family RNA polymerase sigma factor [Chloroflexi bacterium]|nr:sigma-70 family RNA polymerase sigma factor [Chloroflexota bacterium]